MKWICKPYPWGLAGVGIPPSEKVLVLSYQSGEEAEAAHSDLVVVVSPPSPSGGSSKRLYVLLRQDDGVLGGPRIDYDPMTRKAVVTGDPFYFHPQEGSVFPDLPASGGHLKRGLPPTARQELIRSLPVMEGLSRTDVSAVQAAVHVLPVDLT